MRLISIMLIIPFFCSASPVDIYTYCCDKVDEISNTITHDFEKNPIEKYKLYGKMDAYLDVISKIEESRE